MLFACCKRPSTLQDDDAICDTSREEDARRSVQPPNVDHSHFELLGFIIFGVGNQKVDAATRIADMAGDPDPIVATRHRQEFLALEGQGPGAIIKHLVEMLRDHTVPATFTTAAARALFTLSLEASFGTFESSQAHTIKRAMEAASALQGGSGSGPSGLPITPPPTSGSSSWVVLKDSLDVLVPALASVIKSSPRSEAAVFSAQALSNLALGPALVPSLLKRLFPPDPGSTAAPSITKQLVAASHTPFSLASSVAAAQGGNEANIVKVKRWIAQLLLNSSHHRGLSSSLDAARSIHSLLILLEDRTVTSPKIHEICLCAIYNSIHSEENSVQRSIELLSSPHASKAICSQLLDPLSGDCRYYACLVVSCILRSAGFNSVWGVSSSRWSDGGGDDEGDDEAPPNLKRTLQVPRDPHYLKITQLLIAMKVPGCIQQAISSCLVGAAGVTGSSSFTASLHRSKNQQQSSGLTLISRKGLLQTLVSTLHAVCAMVGDRGLDQALDQHPHPLHLIEAGFPSRLLQLISMKSSPDPHLSSSVLALLSYLSSFKITRDQLLNIPSIYGSLCDVLSSPLTLASQQQHQKAISAVMGAQSRRGTNESQASASASASRRNSSSIAVTLNMGKQDQDDLKIEELQEELLRSEAAWGSCRGLAAKILRNLTLSEPESLLSTSVPRSSLTTLVPCLLLCLLAPQRYRLYEKEQKQMETEDVKHHDQSSHVEKSPAKEVDFTLGPATGHSTPRLMAVNTPREILEGAVKKLSGGGGGGGTAQGATTASSSPSLPNEDWSKMALRRALRAARKADDPFCPSSLFLPIQEAALSIIMAPDWVQEVQRHALAILISLAGEETSPEIGMAIRSSVSEAAGIHVITEVMKAASYPAQDLSLEAMEAGAENKRQVAAWCASLLLLLYINAEGPCLDQFVDALAPSPANGVMGRKKEVSPMKASVAFLQLSKQHQQMSRMHRPLQPLNHAAAEALTSSASAVNHSIYGPMVSARIQLMRSPDRAMRSTAATTVASSRMAFHEETSGARVSVTMTSEENDLVAVDSFVPQETPTKKKIAAAVPEDALHELTKLRQPCATIYMNQDLRLRAQETGGLRLDCGTLIEVVDKLANIELDHH